MPQMSLYLNDKTLEDVKAKAVAKKLPVSQVIRLAVEHYLQADERKSARAPASGVWSAFAAWSRERCDADDPPPRVRRDVRPHGR